MIHQTIRRNLIIGILLVGIIVFLQWISDSPFHPPLEHASIEPVGTPDPQDGGATCRDTKIREREKNKALEFDEMYAALKKPLPGLTEFPEQTLQERIISANISLKNSSNFIRFGIDEKMHPSQILLDRILPAFSQENATPQDIIRHAQSTLKQHYFYDMEEGKVLFQEGSGG